VSSSSGNSRLSTLDSRIRFDFVLGGVPRFRAEAPWAWRLLARWARRIPAARRVEAPGRDPLLADAAGDSPLLLVQADPESYLLPQAARRLVEGLAARPDLALLAPVSNESVHGAERSAPAFPYSTPTQLEAEVRRRVESGAEPLPAERLSSPVYAVRRSALAGLAHTLPLRDAAAAVGERGLPCAVDPGAYVHRYGEMDASAREDLAERVPEGARSVLDVGCSRGATAAALRERGVERIVGIEPDPDDAAEAARAYDRVFASRLEDVGEDLAGAFDAILFGDVLEHLEDPSDALSRVRPWLSESGVVVASVPNSGHWSIVDDLIRGRFDYVPYSVLSGTHVRLFTRRTLEDLFAASGYEVESVETVDLPPSPDDAPRYERLRAFPGASEDLAASEFIAVARAAGSSSPPRG
jgi:2-polyprenyl-3-methyl-5-hydroxy-6-metoxy-1,4-benzoquinol methylase